MNELKLFTNDELGSVRVVEIENECWFVAMDVADILGYDRTNDLTKFLEDDEKQTIVKGDFKIAVENNSNNTNIILINESGMYNAILKSNKPNAKRFKKWVTSEVLPSIRRTGSYSNQPQTFIEALELLLILERAKESALIQLNKTKSINKIFSDKLAILTHVDKLYTMTEIAKELGMASAQILNKELSNMQIQYHLNGTWVPTAKYSDLGYFSIKQEVLDNGNIIYHRKVTQMGRDFIISLFE